MLPSRAGPESEENVPGLAGWLVSNLTIVTVLGYIIKQSTNKANRSDIH